MPSGVNRSGRNGVAAGVLIAGAVGLLALPSAVLAFASSFEARQAEIARVPEQTFQPSRLPVRLAPAISLQSLGKGQMFRFTPAGTASRPDRSVTVAVRVDPVAARGIMVRGVNPEATPAAAPAPMQIAPMAFNLGVSRGYHSFAQGLLSPAESRKADTPDLARIGAAPASREDPSRFSPRVILEDRQGFGSAPRTFADGQDQVDLGGAYRLGRNIDVTAGVRYSQERERLRPLTDGKKDNQAVYLGTQFRF
jgi:hypothetical protein